MLLTYEFVLLQVGVLNERAEPEPRLFGLGSFNI
jgi:hypothetical protein